MHFAHAADLSFEEMIIIPCHGARRALCHPRSARYFLRNVSEATLVAELTTSLAFSAKLLIFSLAPSRSISSILSFILSFVLTILSEAEALTPFAASLPAAFLAAAPLSLPFLLGTNASTCTTNALPTPHEPKGCP